VTEVPPVASPCIGVCTLDVGKAFCTGCYRTLAEIAAWPGLSAEERARIAALLPLRRSPG